MELIRPPRLQRGDLVGIISPSSPVAHFVPRRLKRGIAELERLSFRVCLGQHATGKHGHTAGTISDRVADLHEMFADPEVKGIITTIGGSSSHQLLDELDYDLIAANPKVFYGLLRHYRPALGHPRSDGIGHVPRSCCPSAIW